MSLDIDRMPLIREQDLVAARQNAREIAAQLGFDRQDQSRIATAVSEIARNAIRYAREGSIAFAIEGERAPQVLLIRIADSGPGIENLDEILRGRYRSATGMGLGIVGARRLMDRCEIASSAKGTTVVMTKLFDAHAALLTAADLDRIRRAIRAHHEPPADELLQQHDLLLALADSRDRQEELTRLNRELEDTNRGVVALYAELDEKADHLRRADEMKSRFLSNMSHEFRTPLNSIRALSGLLLERVDGPLADEQERQVTLIRKATDDLSNLVEDLLDLARIEAGRLEIHAAEFAIDDLFSALRGMLRPLLVGEAVALRFDPPVGVVAIYTDEAKVSQILRNFISNALKFTEAGSVTVSASCGEERGIVTFCVADTGIGIAPEDHERIFEEFIQVRSYLQARVKGTGLGLPLCRRLAHALGGEVSVESAAGVGSKFFLRLPVRFAEAPEPAIASAPPVAAEPWHIPVLVVEDERDMQLFYEKTLRHTPYRPIAAQTLHQASAALERTRPAAVILDIVLRNEDSWRWLAEFKASPDWQSIPVLVITTVDEQRKAFALGADAFARKPIERAELVALLNQATASRVLIIDDDSTTRYAMRKLLDQSQVLVLEAATGEAGFRVAEIANPRSIVLDLGLPDVNGFELLARLKAAPKTRRIPVIVATAHDLTETERATLEAQAFLVLSKRDMLGTIVANVAAAASSAS